MTLPAKPQPVPSELSRPYWEAAAAGRLAIQRCTGCGTLRHYPRLLCDRCYGTACDWQTATGRGTLHSWTVAHHAFHPGFAAELPYVLVTVDLEEGVRALGRWQGAPELVLGMPVHGAFELRDGSLDLVFSPARDA